MKILKISLFISLLLVAQGCTKEPVNHDYDALLTQYWPTAWPSRCSGLANHIEKQKRPKRIVFTKAARLYLEAICLTLNFDALGCTGKKGETFKIGEKQTAYCLGLSTPHKLLSLKKNPEDLFKKAYQYDNKDKYGVAYYAALLYGKETTKFSLEVQNKAIMAAPQNIELLTNIAESYLEFEDSKSAVYNYKKAIKLATTVKNEEILAKSNYEIADIYYDQEDYEVALTYLKAGLKYADNSFVVLFNLLGMTYDALHENDKAIEMYQKAIKNDEKYWYAYNNLGHALNGQGRFKEAMHILNTALKLDTKREYHDMIYYNLALAVRKRDCKQALKYLQLSVKNDILTKQNKTLQNGVYFNFGRCYVLTKRYDKAIENLSKDTNLTDASYYFLGRAYLAKKDYLKAIEYLQQVQDVEEQPKPEILLDKARKRLEAQH